MRSNPMSAIVAVGIGLLATPAKSQVSATGTQTLNVNIGANAKLRAVQSGVNLTTTGALFSRFAGAVTLQYKVRTTPGTGASTLTVSATGEFTPSTGPRISNSDLTYTCSGATLGVACSGVQSVKTVSQTGVVTLGSGVCTGTGCAGADPNSVTLNLGLENSPTFRTGTYSTGLTFTISSI